MAKEFVEDVVCKLKFDVNLNTDGNIFQDGDVARGVKSFTFGNFASSITASDATNCDDSEALHNGAAGLMWLFSGQDDNFDEMTVKKNTVEEIDYV